MNILLETGGATYWTEHAGVHRWDALLCKPGMYRVIRSAPVDVQRFFGLFSIAHPHAVVDDFGNLVPVREVTT